MNLKEYILNIYKEYKINKNYFSYNENIGYIKTLSDNIDEDLDITFIISDKSYEEIIYTLNSLNKDILTETSIVIISLNEKDNVKIKNRYLIKKSLIGYDKGILFHNDFNFSNILDENFKENFHIGIYKKIQLKEDNTYFNNIRI